MDRIRKQPQTPSVADLQEHFTSDASRRLTDYPQMLATWSSELSPEQVFLAWFEDVHFRPKALLQSVYSFLGLADPPTWPVGLDEPVWKGALETMPLEHATFLADLYAPALDHLAEGADGNGELVYPFYNSPLWPAYAEQESGDPTWIPALQSGTLGELSRASRPHGQDAAEQAGGHR
jgi:hypothetical protein